MSACDNKLKDSLIEAMELDHKQLEAEMQNAEPHVFSDIHEKKMEKLLQRQKRRQKIRGVVRYMAAACIVLLLTGGMFMISSEDLHASKLSIDIIEWLEEFFSTEKGEGGKRENREVLFTEEQIGYLPEGFEKTTEFTNFNLVYYKFENNVGESIHISVERDKSLLQVDNTEDIYKVRLNEAGYEYTGTYSNKSHTGVLVWKGDDELYYQITGIVAYEELVKIMNNISY